MHPDDAQLPEPDYFLADEPENLEVDPDNLAWSGYEPSDDELEDEEGDEDDEPPAPIKWSLLSAEQAEIEWFILNEWVHWYRKRYGLPTAVVPPFWHRHPELVEELSALHLHYLGCFHKDQDGSGPLTWHADSAALQKRLREWVTICGTKLDRDRETRQTVWPGEAPAEEIVEIVIDDREADFQAFVEADVRARWRAKHGEDSEFPEDRFTLLFPPDNDPDLSVH